MLLCGQYVLASPWHSGSYKQVDVYICNHEYYTNCYNESSKWMIVSNKIYHQVSGLSLQMSHTCHQHFPWFVTTLHTLNLLVIVLSSVLFNQDQIKGAPVKLNLHSIKKMWTFLYHHIVCDKILFLSNGITLRSMAIKGKIHHGHHTISPLVLLFITVFG